MYKRQLFDLGRQGSRKLRLGAAHVRVGQPAFKQVGGYGKKVRVVGWIGLIQPAVHFIDRPGQIVGAGADGLPATRLGQQVEQYADGVDQQLFRQEGQDCLLYTSSAPVMVSPTRVSFTFLMEAVNQPTSPAVSSWQESMPRGRR